MKIAFFETEEWEEVYFRSALSGHSLSFYKEPLTEENAPSIDVEVACVFIYSSLTPTVLAALKHLCAVVTRSTGTDHIDRDYCAHHNVQIYNVPTYGAHTVAEHTFALMLALMRNIIQSAERVRSGNFHSEGLMGHDLNGKCLGIIGMGNIGTCVASIALAFGMRVLSYSRTPKEIKGVQNTTLDEIFRLSDIVTLHLPYTPQTHHIINEERIAGMKKGAYIINTARGGLIDTQALVNGLQNGHIAGAALDVLEEEGSIREERALITQSHIDLMAAKKMLLGHVLMDMPQVIITPHNAFNSHEALEEINETTVGNILSAIEKSLRFIG